MSQQINLYEARLRPRHLLLTGRRLSMALAVAIVLLAAWAVWTREQADLANAEAARLMAEVKDLQGKHEALSRQMVEKRLPAALQNELDNARAMLSVRREVVGLLDSGRLGNTAGFSDVFAGFARQADRDLWLTGFSIGLGGQEIEIRGKLFDSSRLPGYVQRLSADPAFQGRRFAALTMDSVDLEAKAAAAPGTPPAAPGTGDAAKLPRHVEFVLRSENAPDTLKPEARK